MAAAKQRRVRDQIPDQTGRDFADLQDWHCWLILTFLVAVFFREILLGSVFFWEDFLYQNYPFRNFAATSMAAGQIPLWNPYTFNGMPFLADIQTTVFYIPCTLLSLFVHEGRLHFYWLELVIILHYLLAGLGMFYLARSYGMRRISALFSGAAFMFSGFMITHVIHQQIVTLAAWYPLILFLFRRVLQDRHWVWVFITALILGHSTLAGYPQLSLYLYSFLGIVFLFELLTTYPGRAILSKDAAAVVVRAASVVFLSLGAASIQLLPTMELSPLSQRAEITYVKATEGSLTWGQLLTFLYPKFFGVSSASQYSYWGAREYWYYWETCVYSGVLTFLLALMSVPFARRSKHVLFFWGIMALALLLALGGNFPLHSLLYHYVPGFSLFRNPARSGVIIALAMALLAGWSLDNLLVGDRDRKLLRTQFRILVVASGVGLAVWILTLSGMLHSTFPFLNNPQIASLLKQNMLPSVLFLIVSGALIYALIRRRWNVPLYGVLFSLLLFADMMWFGGSQASSTVNPSEYFSRTQNIVEPLKQEGKGEFFRVNTRTSRGMIMDRNQGMIDRIFMTEGYTPLALQRWMPPAATGDQVFDLMNVKYKTIPQGDQGLNFVRHATYLPRAFFLYRTYVAKSESELTAYMGNPAFEHRTVAVLEKDLATPLAAPDSAPSWKATITAYENNTILLDAETSRDGILVLSEVYYPGWKATVDGMPAEVYRVDYNLRGIAVPNGHHSIEFRFQPTSFTRGVLITSMTLVVCLMGTVISLRRRRVASQSSGA
jgi:hypothetical protein